jgi:VCBS repeat-containing protein
VTINASPDAETKASYSFDVTATDAAGNATTQTVTLTINDLDEDDPVFSSPTSASVNENVAAGTLVYTAAASDPATDGGPSNPITYSLAGTDAAAFTLNTSTGAVTINASPDAETKASYSFDVTATDAAGNATTQTVTLTINDLDEVAPVVNDQSFNYAENRVVGATLATVAASDNLAVTGFAFTATGTNTSADGFFQIDASGNITLTAAGAAGAANDFETAPNSFVLNVTARDAAGNTDTANITLNVLDANEPPSATNLSAPETYTEDTPLDLTDIVVSDVDSANVTVTLTLSDVTAGTLNTATSGSVTSTFVGGVWTASGAIADVNALLAGLTFTPVADYSGSFTIATSVSDGAFTITGTKNVTGVAVDDLPVAANDLYAATEDVVLNVPAVTGVLANDTGLGDGGLVLNITVAPTSGLVTLNNDGSFSYTPNANANGADTFTYQVRDADGDVSTATVTINVAAVNDAPVPGNNSFVITSGSTTVLSSANLSATDVDDPAGALTFSVSNVVNGRFELVAAPGVAISSFTQMDIVNGAVQFVHTGGAAPSFDLAVSDGSALTGPYAGNIIFTAGTTPPSNGGGTPAAGVAEGAVLAAATGSGPIIDSAPPSPDALPVVLTGLPPAFATNFIRTPLVGPTVVSEGGSVRFIAAEGGLAAKPDTLAADARLGSDGQLPPIRAEGDLIETRITDVTVSVQRLRADELGVKLSEYAYACVPETVDPAPAQMSIVPTQRDLELNAEDKWRLDFVSGALTVTGLVVAAGAVWWAARSAGLISGLLAASPTWRHVDPLPAVGRDEEDEPKAGSGKRARPGDRHAQV